MKTEAWEAIARKVSALSGVVRTGDRIRAKWHDFQSRTKLKLIEQKKEKRRTGGGPPPPDLTQTEENVLNIIGKTATEGISGGIDTSEEVPVTVVSIDRPGLTIDRPGLVISSPTLVAASVASSGTVNRCMITFTAPGTSHSSGNVYLITVSV